LRREDGLRTKKHSTSGSSGTPVEFFVSEMNGQFNQVRSYAQYFIEGRDFTANRTRVKYMKYEDAKARGFDAKKGGLTVQLSDNWLGPLGKLFKSGSNKMILYWRPERAQMLEELSKHAIGYLSVNPDYVDELFADDDLSFLKANGAQLLVTIGAGGSDQLRAKCDAAGVGVRGGYSAEETGLIASECTLTPTHYHVAHSNVIVELDRAKSVTVDGRTLSPVLVTALHSYATPVVRYDVGDMAAMEDRCACGHAGATLSNIVGRSKNLVKHSDGRVSFVLFRANMFRQIARFDEYRIRQTGLSDIVLELGGCEPLTQAQRVEFADFIRAHAGGDFSVDVRTVEAIDWGPSLKRLGFVNELL
jgi:phenylacetate-coenzyme A ligase PaaK-like adenylate-forming protein